MPETQEAPVVSKETLPVKQVTRNGVTKEMSWKTFGKKAVGKAGKPFPTPEVGLSSFENDIKWVGPIEVCNVLTKALRRVFMDIYDNALDAETGIFNWDQWQKDAEAMDTGFPRLSELEDEISELQDQNGAILDSPEFNTALSTEGDEITAELLEFKKTLSANNSKIKALKKQYAEIEAEYAVRAARRKATKEANEAKAKADALLAKQQAA